MNDEWPFAVPKNLATITVRQIVRDGNPILRVSHDEEDGSWQFLEWGTPDEEDAIVVSLLYITQIDPTILELADLPLGWRAFRQSPGELWQREPKLNDST